MVFVARYSEVSSLLAELHSVPEDRLTALRGRLQHLQKLGFPPGINTGRGKPAEYFPGQLILLLIGVELMALGIPPERAARALLAKKVIISAAIISVLASLGDKRSPPLFIRVLPAALFDEDPRLGYVSLTDLTDTLEKTAHTGTFPTRIALVNLSAVILNVAEWAGRRSKDARKEFLTDLSLWAGKLEY